MVADLSSALGLHHAYDEIKGNMSGRNNTHSSTSGQLAELEERKADFGLVITRRRKFAVFSSIECTNLENAIVGALSILLEKFHFDTNVTQLTKIPCWGLEGKPQGRDYLRRAEHSTTNGQTQMASGKLTCTKYSWYT